MSGRSGPVNGQSAWTSFPTSASTLSLSLLEMVSGLSAYTDYNPSVLSPPPSVVAILGTILSGVPLLPQQHTLHLKRMRARKVGALT
ncbi:hypothetical protein DPMN_114754 [Dreissena polymorpha]|uniref:Uncharacterized protein n=1 Tax=Dreissena polymorpha TaxID=45954 RepID=A0A9D4KK03_DREPO|nr:hypothetical protein DPMN_114754 [Dreissena polymorpha]